MGKHIEMIAETGHFNRKKEEPVVQYSVSATFVKPTRALPAWVEAALQAETDIHEKSYQEVIEISKDPDPPPSPDAEDQ